MAMVKPKSVAAYLAAQPPASRKVLTQLRSTLRKALPRATEDISYGIPVYRVDGKMVISFAGWTSNASVYPIGKLVRATLAKDIEPFVTGKGTMQFPYDRPLPLKLIARIAKVRAQEGAGLRPAAKPKKAAPRRKR